MNKFLKTAAAAAVVLLSAEGTLHMLAYNDAKARVAVSTAYYAHANFPGSERGDMLSQAGVPQVQRGQRREALTLAYMLKSWYPRIIQAHLQHNAAFDFEDLVEPAADKTQLLVKSVVCLRPGLVPERLFLNKVYDKGTIPEQDVLNIQTHNDFPFPSTHKGLSYAQYFYSSPLKTGNSYIELNQKPMAVSSPAVALSITDGGAAEPDKCPEADVNREAGQALEADLLKFALEAKKQEASDGTFGAYKGLDVTKLETSNSGIGAEFKAQNRAQALSTFQTLTRQLEAQGLVTGGKATAMLSAEGKMLSDTFFAGYALGGTRTVTVSATLDPLQERYVVQLIYQDHSGQFESQ